MATMGLGRIPLDVRTQGYAADGGCDDCNATQILFHKGATVVTAVTHAVTCPALRQLPSF